MSPTQRALAVLREEGWLVAKVENWNAFAKIRVDLFGFVDLLCLRGSITMGVQVTSLSNVSSRVKKIQESPHLDKLDEAGWVIEVWGVGYHKPRGQKRKSVHVRRVTVAGKFALAVV